LKHQYLNLFSCSVFIWLICCFTEISFSFDFNAISELARADGWLLYIDWVSVCDELGSVYEAKMSEAFCKMSVIDSYSRHLIKGKLLVSDSALHLKTSKFLSGYTNKKQR
jgi:hypothetical protein